MPLPAEQASAEYGYGLPTESLMVPLLGTVLSHPRAATSSDPVVQVGFAGDGGLLLAGIERG